MSDLRNRMERLGERATPTDDAFERLERRRRRKDRNRRIGAGVLALVLVLGGSVAAFSTFRDAERSSPGGGGGTQGFFALWPEQTREGLAQAQERVDDADPELGWRVDPIDIAGRFANEKLQWPAATASAAEGSNLETDDVIFLEVSVPEGEPCDQVVSNATCPTAPLTLTMERLGRVDGLWSITGVAGQDLALPLVPGDEVAVGTTITVPTNLPDGAAVSMGVALLSACEAPSVEVFGRALGGRLQFTVPDVPDGCVGYVYAMRPPTAEGAVAIGSFLFTDAQDIPGIGYLVEEVAAIPVRFANAAPVDVAEFTCNEEGLTPARSVVAAQPDGVHIAITNTTDILAAISVGELGGDGVAPNERGETIWQLPPGSSTVSCSVESLEFGGVATTASLTVVDPQGLYVPAELECADGQGYGSAPSYAEGATGFAGDPAQVVRDHVSGLEYDMQVERAAYPESAEPVVRIVRDGVVIGRVTLFDDGQGGWLPSAIEGCGGTQFGWSEEITGVTGPPADPGVLCPTLGLEPPSNDANVQVGADLHVDGADLGFDANCLGAPGGEPLTILFSNLDDGVPRNISVYTSHDCLIAAAAASEAPTCAFPAPLFSGELIVGVDEIVYELGPLEPGLYYFQDDEHPSANGVLIVSLQR